MKLLCPESVNYNDGRNRKSLAIRLSNIVDGNFVPFNPNQGDDSLWKLDSANDWSLQFSAL